MLNPALFFLIALMLPLSLTAYPPGHSPLDTVPWNEDLLKLHRIRKLLTISPHHKNPDAAGRGAFIRRNTPPATADGKRAQLMGPAYKNKRKRTAARRGGAQTGRSLRLISGPRYKNRTSKARSSRPSRWK